MTTWYEVGESPPPMGCLVFVHHVDSGGVVPAILSEGMWRTPWGVMFFPITVSHWTYLTYPKPPETTRTR